MIGLAFITALKIPCATDAALVAADISAVLAALSAFAAVSFAMFAADVNAAFPHAATCFTPPAIFDPADFAASPARMNPSRSPSIPPPGRKKSRTLPAAVDTTPPTFDAADRIFENWPAAFDPNDTTSLASFATFHPENAATSNVTAVWLSSIHPASFCNAGTSTVSASTATTSRVASSSCQVDTPTTADASASDAAICFTAGHASTAASA